jgi:hypothetical protein
MIAERCTMYTLEEIRERLRDRNLRVVAERTGLGYATVLRVMRGRLASYETVERLSAYLRRANG